MSKPSASGRRRTFGDGRYHRHNLGGGGSLKAVTRTRRSAASRQLGISPGEEAARYQAAMETLLRTAHENLEDKEAA